MLSWYISEIRGSKCLVEQMWEHEEESSKSKGIENQGRQKPWLRWNLPRWQKLDPLHIQFWCQNTVEIWDCRICRNTSKNKKGERESRGNGSYRPAISLAAMLNNYSVNEIWINSVFLKRKKKIKFLVIHWISQWFFQYILYSADPSYSDFIDVILSFELICVCTHVCMHHTHSYIY